MFARTLAFGLALLIAPAAAAQTVEDFYRGKTLSLYVGFPPGGGYDIYARMFAPHFGRHIPGKPSVVVQNMEGGVGAKAAAYMSNATRQDGTALGMFLDNLTLGKVLGGPGEFDPAKLVWIGRIVDTATVAVVWHAAPALTVEEAKRSEVIVGASSASSSSSFIPLALNDLAGTKFRVVRGYQGSGPMALAMERGEIHALGGMSWEAIQTSKQDWLAERKVRFLYTLGARRHKDLPDVPGIAEFAATPDARKVLELLGSGPDIGRSIAAEPGIPAKRAAALRRAFMEAVADPALVDEAKRRNLGLNPLTGEEVQKIVADAMATPRELVEQAQRYAKP
jgi:tripartite-type tricarboxylate transporter receptor subunit TctC